MTFETWKNAWMKGWAVKVMTLDCCCKTWQLGGKVGGLCVGGSG